MEPTRPGGARLPAAWRRHAPWLAGFVVLVLLSLVLLREPLGERLWPQARIDRLLAEGRQALAEGRLDEPNSLLPARASKPHRRGFFGRS